jgi:hypothetical protein
VQPARGDDLLLPASEAVRVALPTAFGLFEARAFERPSGHVYVALVLGDLDGAD